jgi:hypothetical protein
MYVLSRSTIQVRVLGERFFGCVEDALGGIELERTEMSFAQE